MFYNEGEMDDMQAFLQYTKFLRNSLEDLKALCILG